MNLSVYFYLPYNYNMFKNYNFIFKEIIKKKYKLLIERLFMRNCDGK